MNRLVARILLASVTLGAALVVWMTVAVVLNVTVHRVEISFNAGGAAMAVFLAVAWPMHWRRTVRWTRRRVTATALAAVPSVVVAVGVAWVGNQASPGIATILGWHALVLVWLLLTIVLWRDTPAERVARLRGAHVRGCAQCGANLTGLLVRVCPECGAPVTTGAVPT